MLIDRYQRSTGRTLGLAGTLIGAALIATGFASQATARNAPNGTFAASQDTFVLLGGASACANWGGYNVIRVGTNAKSIRRGLIEFELSSLPAGTQIASATLSLYQTTPSRGSGVIGVHQVTTRWAEGVEPARSSGRGCEAAGA